MVVGFPLAMADGATVRTIDELREHFDTETVAGGSLNGKLSQRLRNFFYDEEELIAWTVCRRTYRPWWLTFAEY